MRRALLFAAILSLGVFIPGASHAITLFYNASSSWQNNQYLNTNADGGGFTNLQFTPAVSGSITTTTLAFSSDNVNSPNRWGNFSGFVAIFDAAHTQIGTSQTITANFSTYNQYLEVNYPLIAPVNVLAGANYWICYQGISANAEHFLAWNGHPATIGTLGTSTWYGYHRYHGHDCFANERMDYGTTPASFIGRIDGQPAPPDEISIEYPVPGTTIGDFSSWGFSYHTATSTNYTQDIGYEINVYLSAATSTLGTPAGGGLVLGNITGTTAAIDKTQALAPNMIWFARADLIYHPYSMNPPDGGVLVAQSPVISFETGGGGASGSWFPTPTSTATSTNFTITCDPDSGYFTNSLCNVGVFLFVPSQDSLNNFSNLQAYIGSKPPFGYFAAVKNAFGTLASSTTTLALPSLGFADSFLGPIKTGISWLIWFVFGFWIWHKFRNIEL